MSLDHALEIAALGRPVLPCWQDKAAKFDYRKASLDPETIRQWHWNDALIGLRPFANDGFVVFDVDRQAVEASHWIFDTFGMPAFCVPSRKAGGFHYYYSASENIGNSSFQYGDVRGGNGYIIAHHPERLIEALRGDLTGATLDAGMIARAIGKDAPNGISERKGTSGCIEGNRNNWLNKEAFIAGQHGDKKRLKRAKKTARAAGLEDTEIKSTAKAAFQRGQKADTSRNGLSKIWAAHEGKSWLFVTSKTARSYWASWTGTHWDKQAGVYVFESVRKLLEELSLKREITDNSVQGIVTLSRGQVTELEENFDTEPLQINTPNGVINLQTGDLIPHDPLQRNMKITAVRPDFEASCPLWDQALHDWTKGDAELQRFLQVTSGLALRGDNAEQVFLILYGDGQNGKSVFVDTLSKIMQGYSKAASSTVFKLHRFEQHPAELAALEGVRLVTIPELPKGMTLNESLLKSFTGNDEISARGMRQDPRSFKPVGLPVMYCNHLPNIVDVGISMQRRTLLVPFEYEVPDSKKDGDLCKKLEPEFPAILAWMIEGHLMYLDSGLVKPERVVKSNAQHFKNMDVMKRFFDERLQAVPDSFISTEALHSGYLEWCRTEGIKYPLTRNKFSMEFSKRFGIEKRKLRQDQKWYWQEISWIL